MVSSIVISVGNTLIHVVKKNSVGQFSGRERACCITYSISKNIIHGIDWRLLFWGKSAGIRNTSYHSGPIFKCIDNEHTWP